MMMVTMTMTLVVVAMIATITETLCVPGTSSLHSIFIHSEIVYRVPTLCQALCQALEMHRCTKHTETLALGEDRW